MNSKFDIRSGNSYPSNYLSNFAGHSFVFDGILCASMEGLLQSLKFKRWVDQAEMCQRRGMDAKIAGKKMSGSWCASGNLWWREQPLARHKPEYQDFLNRAYQALYDQCPAFRKALEDTGFQILTHDIGINNAKITILTIDEFVNRLTMLRSGLRLVNDLVPDGSTPGL